MSALKPEEFFTTFLLMTSEHEIALRNFEALVRQLMRAYESVRASNEALLLALDENRQKLEQLEGENEMLRHDYELLKTARMIEVSDEDVKASRARIAKLIREVDKCIALLDV